MEDDITDKCVVGLIPNNDQEEKYKNHELQGIPGTKQDIIDTIDKSID